MLKKWLLALLLLSFGFILGVALAPQDPSKDYVQVEYHNTYSQYELCGIEAKDFIILAGKNFGAKCGDIVTLHVGDRIISGELAGILLEDSARIEIHYFGYTIDSSDNVLVFDRLNP